MKNKRRLVGAAAGCAVAIATLLGTPAAGAQEECVRCEVVPGAPVDVFLKIAAPEDVFQKVEPLIPTQGEYPGRTEDVFFK